MWIRIFLLLLLCCGAWALPFKDTRSGAFEYQPPASWTYSDDLWHNAAKDQVVVSDSVEVQDLTLQQWAEAVVQKGVREKGWQQTRISDAVLGGLPAKRISAVEGGRNSAMNLVIYIPLRDRLGSILTFVSSLEDAPELETQIGEVVKSFRWL